MLGDTDNDHFVIQSYSQVYVTVMQD